MQSLRKRSTAVIKRQIVEFLNATCGLPSNNLQKDPCGTHHRTCLVLATCYKNIPRATPLEFFNEGLTLYVFAEPSTKIANISTTPLFLQLSTSSRLTIQYYKKASRFLARRN